LKSVSRRRSEVGRTCIDGGLFSFRPLYSPAITRIDRLKTGFQDYKIKKRQKEGRGKGKSTTVHLPLFAFCSLRFYASSFTRPNLVILKSCLKN